MLQLKSIKTKLSLSFGGLLLIICAGLGIVSYIASSNALTSSINESLSQMSKEASMIAEGEVKSQFNVLEAMAGMDFIKSDELLLEEKIKLLEEETERNGHVRMGIADLKGNAVYTDGTSANVSDRDYYKRAISGKREVSDPIISKVNNSVVLVYAVPIKDNGTVKGVLIATRDGNVLSDITNSIKFGKNGEAFMISSNGTTIAHKDEKMVMEMYNAIEDVKNEPDLKPLVELEKQMITGKEGTGEYTFNGVTKYMAFSPVPESRWSLAITAPKAEIMAGIHSMAIKMIIISFIFLGISIILAFLIALSISKPVKKASDYLQIVSTGDFTVEIPEGLLKGKDETGILANAINTMQQSIKGILTEVVIESSNVGGMLININNQMEQLNKSIEEISATTEELSAGTEQTASSTEEMSASSAEIEKAAESIAAKAEESIVIVTEVNRMADEMKQSVTASKENTIRLYSRTKNSLQNAIEQAEGVNQINELSESILEITSQTNLLALNAAIEAARAGEAGKGFAVVAEEIRKLAENSKNTVNRIQEITSVILDAVKNLSTSSGEILEFIDRQILNDYENLVKSSEQYSNDSFRINDMITDFSATSEELLASVQNMVTAINEIATASNEEAQGASNIAQEASNITQESLDVIKLADAARAKSDDLIKSVSKFKV